MHELLLLEVETSIVPLQLMDALAELLDFLQYLHLLPAMVSRLQIQRLHHLPVDHHRVGVVRHHRLLLHLQLALLEVDHEVQVVAQQLRLELVRLNRLLDGDKAALELVVLLLELLRSGLEQVERLPRPPQLGLALHLGLSPAEHVLPHRVLDTERTWLRLPQPLVLVVGLGPHRERLPHDLGVLPGGLRDLLSQLPLERLVVGGELFVEVPLSVELDLVVRQVLALLHHHLLRHGQRVLQLDALEPQLLLAVHGQQKPDHIQVELVQRVVHVKVLLRELIEDFVEGGHELALLGAQLLGLGLEGLAVLVLLLRQRLLCGMQLFDRSSLFLCDVVGVDKVEPVWSRNHLLQFVHRLVGIECPPHHRLEGALCRGLCLCVDLALVLLVRDVLLIEPLHRHLVVLHGENAQWLLLGDKPGLLGRF
mmetsp:Transcript_18429/g.40022  ORF Transcript_18429/g.40022 Transcript_18429/m.40022 type:complete len:423 (-) Transcript_18429:212-1480(-)